jgi:hypothetical protein
MEAIAALIILAVGIVLERSRVAARRIRVRARNR